MARSALFESADRWAGPSRRTLAFGVMTRSSGPLPSSDDGWDLATCPSVENGHLRYLRDLRALCDSAFVMPSCLCVFVFAMALCSFSVPLCLCGSTRGGWGENLKSEISLEGWAAFRISNFRRGEAFRPIGICCPRFGVSTAYARNLHARCIADVDAIASRHVIRNCPSAGGRFRVLRAIPRVGKFEIRNSKFEIAQSPTLPRRYDRVTLRATIVKQKGWISWAKD